MKSKKLNNLSDLGSIIISKDITVNNHQQPLISEYQVESISEYQNSYKFTSYQNHLYNRALYGLKIYTPEQIEAMHWQKKSRIIRVCNKTQVILNRWKQEQLIQKTNKVFELFFHSSLLSGVLMEHSIPSDKFICNVSFKDLNITKEDVVRKLYAEKILPNNFYSLTNTL